MMPIKDSNPIILLVKFFILKHSAKFKDEEESSIVSLLIGKGSDNELRGKFNRLYGDDDVSISILRELKPCMDGQDPELMELLAGNDEWNFQYGQRIRRRFGMPEAIIQFFALGLYGEILATLSSDRDRISCSAHILKMLRTEFRMNIDTIDSLSSMHGGPPIHMEISCCATDRINVLMEAGVPLWARDVAGKSPLMLTILKGHHEAAALFDGEDGSKRGGSRGRGVCRGSQMWLFYKILNADIEETKQHINDQSKSGMTALHAACAHGYERYIIPLLQAGADVYAKDKYGLTPLDYLPISESGEVRSAEFRRQAVQDWLLRYVPRVVNDRKNFDRCATWDSRYSESTLSHKDVLDIYNKIRKDELGKTNKQLGTIADTKSTVAKSSFSVPRIIAATIACMLCAGGIAGYIKGEQDNDVILLVVAAIAFACAACLVMVIYINPTISPKSSTLLESTEANLATEPGQIENSPRAC